MRPIQVGNLTLDGSRLFLIAGPCVIESYERTLMIGREIKKICEQTASVQCQISYMNRSHLFSLLLK